MKITGKAPLPFAGQKRMWIKCLAPIIEAVPPGTVFVDVFGGSGLLSRLCKDLHPSSRVIYNDYDDYSRRLYNIEQTEILRKRLFEGVQGIPRRARIHDTTQILSLLDDHLREYSYIDYITLSSWLLFSNNYAYSIVEFSKAGLYNCIPRAALPSRESCTRYLSGLEIIREDWRDVLERYRDEENVLFLVDPPYLSTVCTGYS